MRKLRYKQAKGAVWSKCSERSEKGTVSLNLVLCPQGPRSQEGPQYVSALTLFLHRDWVPGQGTSVGHKRECAEWVKCPCPHPPPPMQCRLNWWPGQDLSQRINLSQWDILFWAGSESKCQEPAHQGGNSPRVVPTQAHSHPWLHLLPNEETETGQRQTVPCWHLRSIKTRLAGADGAS